MICDVYFKRKWHSHHEAPDLERATNLFSPILPKYFLWNVRWSETIVCHADMGCCYLMIWWSENRLDRFIGCSGCLKLRRIPSASVWDTKGHGQNVAIRWPGISMCCGDNSSVWRAVQPQLSALWFDGHLPFIEKANHRKYACILLIQVLYRCCSISMLFLIIFKSLYVFSPERRRIFSKAFQFDIVNIPLSVQVMISHATLGRD